MYKSSFIAVLAAFTILLPAGAALQESDATRRNPPPGGSEGAGPPPAPAVRTERTRERITDYREVFSDTPVTRAVDRGLEYLRERQERDGSWISPHYEKNTGLVSLAIMAFLARGHLPGRGPYGDALERGIAWVLESERAGLLHRGSPHDYDAMYSHGISTLLLGEVLGVVDDSDPRFRDIARIHDRAVGIILRAQAVPKDDRFNVGGWRYHPSSTDSDISVTGWQILALRAAEECGLEIPGESIALALAYIERSALPGGGFRYTNFTSDSTLGRTGTGVLVLELVGEHHSREALEGGQWLLRHPIRWGSDFFYYGAYYGAQAMYQLGGPYWTAWKPISESVLLDLQERDGSWPLPPRTPQEADAGRVYTTALAILALSVEFRYLPIYQR